MWTRLGRRRATPGCSQRLPRPFTCLLRPRPTLQPRSAALTEINNSGSLRGDRRVINNRRRVPDRSCGVCVAQSGAFNETGGADVTHGDGTLKTFREHLEFFAMLLTESYPNPCSIRFVTHLTRRTLPHKLARIRQISVIQHKFTEVRLSDIFTPHGS